MELLPCPFCGSSDIAFQEGSTFRWIEAMCQNCGATCGETRATTLGEPDEEGDKRLAATEWNRRASPASAPEGFALVPVVPTHAILDVMFNAGIDMHDVDLTLVYRAMLAASPTPPVSEDQKDAELYKELIYAVANKFPGESRHQTALRYIRNAEKGSDNAAMQEDTP